MRVREFSMLIREMEEKQLNNSYDMAIILPTLNEERGVKITINSIKKILNSKLRYKIIVVDGLSTDKTIDVAKKLGAVVIRQRRLGTGDALQAGFNYAETRLDVPIIAMMDADGTYDARDLLTMVNIINKGEADFVTGNRLLKMDKNAMTRTNKFGNKMLSAIARKLLKINIADTQSGIRAFKTDLASMFYTVSTGFPFVTEMLVTMNAYGIRVKEIPVFYHARYGNTNLNPFDDGSKILSAIIRLMRDSRPLVFFGSIGLISTVVGLLFGIQVIMEWLETGLITRIPRTILSALLILMGVQTISLGLISDLIKNRTLEKKSFL